MNRTRPALSPLWASLFLIAALLSPLLAAPAELSGTRPLESNADLAAEMVAGIDAHVTRLTAAAAADRPRFWKRDFSSPEAYTRSVSPNRERLRRILGVVDPRLPQPRLEVVHWAGENPLLASRRGYDVTAVRWPVLPGVEGEGLLLQPERNAVATVIAIPDCDTAPEALAGLVPGLAPEEQFARRLAESGCRVLIPMLIDRRCDYSGSPEVRMTNQPHREFLYRAAFEMGRTLTGLEIQKVLAAVDCLEALPTRPANGGAPATRIGIAGYGEGGLIAFYAAALDERLGAALVSGYFGPREELWREPIYRNVWGLLEQFGDAEIATLIAPRPLIVEASQPPQVTGPPPATPQRSGAAPGAIPNPSAAAVSAEVGRARELAAGLQPAWSLQILAEASGKPGSEAALGLLLRGLGVPSGLTAPPVSRVPYGRGQVLRERQAARERELAVHVEVTLKPEERHRRQFDQLLEYTQRLMRDGEAVRNRFWARADPSNAEKWRDTTASYRDYLWDEVIGRLPSPSGPADPRTRQVSDEPSFRGYEVVLDVWPGVIAYGILLVPKDIRPGERRPVVVCQHGLEGRPADVADPRVDSHYYHQFACRLAERGFVTFSPQNPYIGGDRFRVLQRKANPLKKSLFSVIVRQHERILEWLGTQPFVDPERIGFYGLSYGGKTAMRVPALLPGYCLSICSGDYNEWIWKNVSSRSRYSYLFTGEYEMPEFDLGNTFNYAEMSALIAPRPFMVERGHQDGVAPDEWVAYEFAKTRRLYTRLGVPERTEIEFFDGPHTIHGVGTFDFLHRHLNWPAERRAGASIDEIGRVR